MALQTKYDKRTLKEMFGGVLVSPILPYQSLSEDSLMLRHLEESGGRISLSGVQPKYSMTVEDGQLRLTHAGERGMYILKPAPIATFILDKQYIPYNEYLTMHIASDIYQLPTAANCLCYFGNGDVAYLTRRFDIAPDGHKYQQEDFASIAGITASSHGENYKYDALSYEECAPLIMNSTKAGLVEVLRFFRVVVFNYLFSNDDAHLKNFSLIAYRPNDYVMSPAYDMINTALHLSQPQIFALSRGLFKEDMQRGDVYSVNGGTFLKFGTRIGLPQQLVQKEINFFGTDREEVYDMVSQSGLTTELKKHYIKTYNYRRTTLLWC